MKVKSVSFQRDDVTKKNVKSEIFRYDSVVNNNTGKTSEELLKQTALALTELYYQKEGKEC